MPILKKGKPDDSPTATFTAEPFRRRARRFSPCVRMKRSAMTRFIRWRRNWTGSKCRVAGRKPRLKRRRITDEGGGPLATSTNRSFPRGRATLQRFASVYCWTERTMPSPQPLSLLVLAMLVTLEAGATAQPTVPRDRAPVVPGAIRSFVDRLYSPDPKERAEAACQIGRRHAEAASAIPILLSMLSDDVPVPALECEMSPWLRRTLPSSPDARKWMETSPAKEAAEALGDIGNAAVPGLLQSLAHVDWKVRALRRARSRRSGPNPRAWPGHRRAWEPTQ